VEQKARNDGVVLRWGGCSPLAARQTSYLRMERFWTFREAAMVIVMVMVIVMIVASGHQLGMHMV
jgi:hypothetical protein